MSIATCNCILCYLSSFLGTISSTGLSPPISITKSQFLFITKLDDAESLWVSEQAVKEARKGFFGCYSVCETMKDTKEGYFIV